MVERIAHREGFGDVLAEGSARAAEAHRQGGEELVVAVKSHELPAHMPEVKRSLALIYAVNPFGADHQSIGARSLLRGRTVKYYKERMAPLDLLDPQPEDSLDAGKIRYAALHPVALQPAWTA